MTDQKKPLITILLSAYNSGETIERTLESLMRQTFQDFSVVAIDDASQDGTEAVLKKWQLTFGYDRFMLLKNESNLGLTKSLNKGLSIITSRYTARIDADDWWHPEKLARQMAFLESHPEYGLIGCRYANVFKENQKTIVPPKQDQEIRRKIFGYNPFAHSAIVFRTGLVKDIGGYDEHILYGQDYDLWLRLLPKTKFYNLPELLCYRTGDSGLSKSKQNEQIHQYMRTQWKYMRLYRYPFYSYFSFIRPLAVLAAPDWLKDLKRRFFL